MSSKITAEVYVAINEEGDVETGCTLDEATVRLSENFGGQMVRVIRKLFLIAPPQIQDLCDENVPDDEGDVTHLEQAAE
jgi:hypothetical protein